MVTTGQGEGGGAFPMSGTRIPEGPVVKRRRDAIMAFVGVLLEPRMRQRDEIICNFD